MLKRYIFFTVILAAFFSCSQKKTPEKNLLEKILQNRDGVVEQVMENPEKYRLQIIYTQIDRDSLNQPVFSTSSFRADEKEYFYPASTVKFPAASLALEKLNRLGTPHLNRDTPMFTDSAYSRQSAVYAD
ncbi:MAG: hypothetical protein R3C61_12005, partial [Bacteroidia bacterium]